MKRTISIALAAIAALPVTAIMSTAAPVREPPVEFKDAALRVEINATDGDAGLQVDLDHAPWRSIQIRRPDGQRILDFRLRNSLRGYGLTELFSESSEPPFEKFPLSEFKKLFPAGTYIFEGQEIDGTRMRSAVVLTHDFPAGPKITSPEEDSTVPAGGFVVRWEPVTKPAGIEIVGYQVVVSADKGFTAELGPDATSVPVPASFLEPGIEYKVEVLAIEAGGNQTLTEVAFTVA